MPIKVIWLSNTPPIGSEYINGTINYVPNNSYTELSNMKVYPMLNSLLEFDGIKYVPVSAPDRTCDAIDCIYDESAGHTKIANTITYRNITMTVKNIGDSLCSGNTYIDTLDYSFNGDITSNILSGCNNITSVTIGGGVKQICENVFSDCKALKNVVFEEAKDDTPLTLGGNGHSNLFANCPLDSVHLGRELCYDTTNDAGYSPFYCNTTLRSVTLTDRAREIHDYEFSGCSNLKDVNIGNGTKTIGAYAFSGCSSLERVACGKQLDSISTSAFLGCKALTEFKIQAAIPPICGSQALYDINKWECTLFVPRTSIDSYQMADQWKEFFFIEGITVRGDVNGDDIVTMADANMVVNYFLATDKPEGFDTTAADVNKDGSVTMADANQIENMFLGSKE